MDMIMEILLAMLIFCLTLLGYCLCMKFLHKNKQAPVPCSTLIVLGSGGHTTEMLTIARHLSKCLYTPRIYLIADTDKLSRSKVEELESGRLDYMIETVQRVREVGQSWISTAFGVPRAIFQSIKIFSFYNPTLIMCNGPGICVPVCMIAKFFRFYHGFGNYTVYVESICRVNSLSLTGKILRYFVDKFFIQWHMQGTENFNIINFGRIS